MHNGGISPCEGTDTEGKEEGTANLITTLLSIVSMKKPVKILKLTLKYCQEKMKLEKGGTPLDPSKITQKDKELILRPLNMADLKEAKNQVNWFTSTMQIVFANASM